MNDRATILEREKDEDDCDRAPGSLHICSMRRPGRRVANCELGVRLREREEGGDEESSSNSAEHPPFLLPPQGSLNLEIQRSLRLLTEPKGSG